MVSVARREDRLKELTEQCRVDAPNCDFLAGDLGDRSFAESIVHDTVARCGSLDILINNAAMPKRRNIYAIDPEEVERVMNVNFFSCVWTTLAAIPHLLNTGGGTIVNVSSFASKVVPTYETVYAASKSAMNGFSEGLWNDLAGSGIHVALVHPGPIDTEIWSKGEEPHAFRGKKFSPDTVALGILECIESKRHEVILPRRNPALLTARFLRYAFPGVLRSGVARMDPVSPEYLEAARARARDAPIRQEPDDS